MLTRQQVVIEKSLEGMEWRGRGEREGAVPRGEINRRFSPLPHRYRGSWTVFHRHRFFCRNKGFVQAPFPSAICDPCCSSFGRVDRDGKLWNKEGVVRQLVIIALIFKNVVG